MGRMNFINTDYPYEWLKNNFDVLFISETHLTKGQQYKLNDFKDYHNSYSDHDAKKPRGGISCFIKNHLLQYVDEVLKDSDDNITIIWKGGSSIFGSYIPPDNSPYFDPLQFCHLANSFMPIDSENLVIGGGDINSRVGNKRLNLPFPGARYNHNVDDFINCHGREVRKLCRAYDCYIVNNLVVGDKEFCSGFTFHRGDQKSQNDIILANKTGLHCISSFDLQEIGWNPSDHTPVSVSCELYFENTSIGKLASIDILTDQSLKAHRKPKKVDPTNVDWDTYKDIVNNDFNSYKQKITNLSDNCSLENLDEAVNHLSESLYKATTVSAKRNGGVNDTPLVQQRSDVFTLADEAWTSYRAGDTDVTAWNNARTEAIEHIRTVAGDDERRCWNTVLSTEDSKQIWNKINWKGSLSSSDGTEKPELSDLCDHFKAKSEALDDSTLLCEVTGDTYVEVLDGKITTDEIEKGIKGIAEDKVSGDGWTKRMLSTAPMLILYAIQIIFNAILSSHFFPTKWRMTTVAELFKNKGLPFDATKYRPISLVELLAKLFDSVLLERFKKWFIPSDPQTAYQKLRSYIDHVFLIRCLIRHAKLYKKKLFIIAVDFDGAFDRISRSVLIRKLVLFGAGTLFVACLASIYMKTDNIIFRNKDYMIYTLGAGIKQGLPLSPYLFLFYVDDIFEFFDVIYGRSKEVIFEVIHILLHADDATLLASTRTLAIEKIRSLLQYCSKNCIIPQYTKCEFTVINGTKKDKEPLEFGDNRTINHVSDVGLLGNHLSCSGKLTDDLNLDFCDRFRNCIKYFNFLRSNRYAPLSVKFKVLKACVMGSLLSNSDSFGFDMPKDLENQYHKLIKCTLGVRQSTPNLLVLLESGLFPLKALSRQLKFYKRFTESLQANSARREVFDQLKSDPNEPYIQHYINISQKYTSKEEIYRESLDEMKNQVNVKADNGDYKFDMYRKMNPSLVRSPFISLPHPLSSALIKFRLGSHKLPVETGRWYGIRNRNDRVCGECGVLGDELHYIYNCTQIKRDDIMLPENLEELWQNPNVFKLFSRLMELNVL